MPQRNGFYVYWSGSRAYASGENYVGQGMTYQYDDFNRLTGMKNSAGTATYTYDYDLYGNRVDQNALQGGGSFHQSYSATTNQLPLPYTYDAAGNMTHDASGGHNFTYDAEGNILQVDAGQSDSWTFVFDALNHRVRAQYSGGSSEGVYDIAGHNTSGWSGPTTSSESHIFADSQQIAFRSGDGKTYFTHKNWLGTDRVTTDLNGNTGATYNSLPFGDGGSANVLETYAGWDFQHFGDMDVDYWDSTYHAQFRNYSELQARWLSPDPYDGSYDASNPQSFNRYAYVLNNPLSLTDSSGLDWNYNPTDGCWDWGYNYTSPDGTEGTGTIDGCGYDAGVYYGGGFYGNPNSSAPGGGVAGATLPANFGPPRLAILSSAPNNGTSTNPFHNQCVSNALLQGGASIGLDAVGLLPEAGGLTRLFGNSFGYKGVVADQRAARIFKGVNNAWGSVSTIASTVGGTLFDTSEDTASTVLTVTGFIPVLGQVSAGLSIGVDAYKTWKAVQQCP